MEDIQSEIHTHARLQLGFPDATFIAVGTLAFVAPENALPRLVEQLREDLDPQTINSLSDSDIAVWSTPEGTTYVNGQFGVITIRKSTVTDFMYSFGAQER